MSSPNQLSFLPDDYMERKAQRRTNLICAVLFILVTSSIGMAFSITERALVNARSANHKITEQYTEAAKPIEQFQTLQQKQRIMAHQAELTSSLLEKVPRSFLLAEVTNAMPSGVSLLELALDSKIKASPGQAKTAFQTKRDELKAKKDEQTPETVQPRVYDVTIKLTGVAPTDVQVAQFITRLNQSTLLQNVNLVISDEHKLEDEKVRKFQIDMTLNPSAEVEMGVDPRKRTASTEVNN